MALELFEYIKQLDQNLFLYLNGLHHPFLDPVMSFISGRVSWVPFYMFLLYLVVKHQGINSLKIILPAIVLLILASDQISLRLFKEAFQRYRPCYNEDIKHLVHLVDGCGGKHGFVSSHAANTFALAVFLGKLLKDKIRLILPFMLIWAAIVSYSRIYLGVHYPADIIVGGALGAGIGWGIYRLYSAVIKAIEKRQVKLSLKNQ